MSLQVYYEESFYAERGRSPTELADEAVMLSKSLALFTIDSKNRFLTNLDWQKIKVLEMGAGRGGVGLQLARLGAQVTLVDFSPSALEQAKRVFANEGFEVTTIVADVSHPDVQFSESYELIVDSHLLHCLTFDPDRLSYLQLVKESLATNGIFVAETMVHRKKLYIPDGFMYDENHVLWQMFGEWKPVRKILDSLDLEQELNTAKLHIAYFFYYGQYGFVPHKSFMDIPNEILPAAVRLVAQNLPE